jgi:tetratricopeptide (TPR) repeat protein
MKIVSALLKFILPIIIIFIAFTSNALAGLALLLIYAAILAYTGRATLFRLIGGTQYSKGNLEQALAWFEKSCNTKKAKPGAIISYGYILLKTGHPDKAEQVLLDLLKKKPGKDNEFQIKSNLSLVYWKKGRLDEAVALLEEVIAEYKTTTIYGSLGYLLIMQGDLDKALKFNLEAYDYNSTNAIILDNLAQNYFLKGMFDESQETYGKLLAQNPSFPEAYYNYALLLVELGQKDKALEMLEKALNSKFSYLSDLTVEKVNKKLEEVRADIAASQA